MTFKVVYICESLENSTEMKMSKCGSPLSSVTEGFMDQPQFNFTVSPEHLILQPCALQPFLMSWSFLCLIFACVLF